MKHSKISRRVFAFGLALSMIVTGSSISPNTASAAKKPTISKSKVSLLKGKTTTLSVKNAKKKVKWSSNKKKIVKITKTSGAKKSTATIKGLKKGSAVITAKIGTKKVKCKVTVKVAKPNFKSVSVDKFDRSCLVLNLKKKDSSLTETSFTVYAKSRKQSSFNETIPVQKVVTTNGKTYRIYLESYIGNGSYVQVKSGISSASAQLKRTMGANETTNNLLIEKGSTVNRELNTYFFNAIGSTSYTVTSGKLPAGLTIDSSNGVLKGQANTVGSTTVTLQCADEMGRKVKTKLVIGVYDKSTVVAGNVSTEVKLNDYVEENASAATASNATALDKDKVYYQSVSVYPKGGSGNYTFTLSTPDNAEVRLSTDVIDDTTKAVSQKIASNTAVKIPYSIKSGKHTYTVTITDAVNPALTTKATVSVNAVKYYNVSGAVKSSNGLNLAYTEIEFIPSTAKGDGDISYNESEVDASYAMELPAGKYTVKVHGDVIYQMSGTYTVGKDMVKNISVPVRYATVSGKATYKNTANKLKNKTIYFETLSTKFEGARFMAFTDDEGSFSTSLPSNKYAAYIVDEKGNRKYFSKTITVKKADQVISSMAASISRYKVEGIVFNGTSVDPTTQKASVLDNTNLYFYDEQGNCVSGMTASLGNFKVYLEGGKTYVVRANFGGARRTVGTVKVDATNVKDITLTYTKEVELGAAQDITAQLGTEVSFVSKGANDIVGKFVPVETNLYDVTVSTAIDAGSLFYIYDADGQVVTNENGLYSLEAAMTYYIKVIPNGVLKTGVDSTPQGQGEVKVKIMKLSDATALTLNTPVSLTSVKNKGVYTKLLVTNNEIYDLNFKCEDSSVKLKYQVVNENGSSVISGDISNGSARTVNLSKGTYYILMMPHIEDSSSILTTTFSVTLSSDSGLEY